MLLHYFFVLVSAYVQLQQEFFDSLRLVTSFLVKQVQVYEGKADVKLDNCSFGILGESHAYHTYHWRPFFSVAAARAWNSITSAPLLLVFRRMLKTELCCHSFPEN